MTAVEENGKPLRIVIVGGVAGGASAAARARRVNSRAEITLIEKGPVISFANCGLPYHLGGEIAERGKLLVATSDLFWKRFRIRVLTGHEVRSIDRQARTVTGQSTNGSPFEVPYDKLILATGSEPLRPSFFQPDLKNVFHLWTLDDMDRILAVMNGAGSNGKSVRRATVIGAGFVGLEVVEQLVRKGIEVNVVERLPQVLGPMDSELAKLIQQELEKKGVRVHLDQSVESLLRTGDSATAVRLASGTNIDTDLVIVGAGVRPRTQLAVDADLPIGASGCVLVNEYMQTADPLIYAVGDMAEYKHGVTQQATRMPLAGPANRSGRIAGTHAARSKSESMGKVMGTSIVRVFELTAGATGLNERACKSAGVEYRTVTIQAAHHASYFPGSKNLYLKLVYAAKDGRLLGAQAVGADGCDKRLDIAATVLHFGGTVHDLTRLDLAYAPPFGSAKDPMHMAGFVAVNDLNGWPRLAHVETQLDDYQVVDVRNAQERIELPLAGAVPIPVDELADRWQELDPAKPTIVVCHSGKRAHVAATWLLGHGFSQVWNLNGGMSLRRLAGLV